MLASTSLALFLGIDLGLHGAVAVVSETGELVSVANMPHLNDGPKGRATINAPLFVDLTIEHQSITGGVIDDVETTKLD
jgi:hypothetical protein